MTRGVKSVLVAVVLTAVVTGCALVRKATYPPDFVYLEKTQVVGAMAELNVDLWRIDDIIAGSETILPYKREEIIGILRHMETVANRLGAGPRTTNHLFIDDNIDAFKEQVLEALRFVEKEPPNYYFAGRLSGGCMACHQRR